ncbi:MAG: hypothetical protein M1834_000260 [Cirrosporium novae-zelandiae]|nr:MAG: hypothetical protein M1834_000260 [Cirrosporium novae-zelandiae]
MVSVASEYISIGGNRNPAAADWDADSGLLAFGADKNVALWNPLTAQGVRRLFSGHSDQVTAVRFFPHFPIIITGSADRCVRIWQASSISSLDFSCKAVLEHRKSINIIAVEPQASIFAVGAADATISIWKFHQSPEIKADLVQKINITPRFIPLALALNSLQKSIQPDSVPTVLAAAGTNKRIQLYTSNIGENQSEFSLSSTLEGHEGWINSLAITQEDNSHDDLIMASASQDKYIRLWRVSRNTTHSVKVYTPVAGETALKPLEAKLQSFQVAEVNYAATFEALLIGHEDWIHTSAWTRFKDGQLRLLTTSADNSLAIWSKSNTGIWVCDTRLGEINAQKGSTTATGSTGGFWIGLWSPNGQTVTSLSRTGSWRLWDHDTGSGRWIQRNGISGHVRAVTGITWSSKGEYLLSTSSDQTTRLHSRWIGNGQTTWHEFSRPQIHGYDLNCIASLGSRQFISGADEKLLRVFDEPKPIAKVLERLCGVKQIDESIMPESASMPVLGLSNKATENEEQNENKTEDTAEESRDAINPASASSSSSIPDLQHPPLEDDLARHTLWPECEKLYGHGYEISAIAASHDLRVVATACKASSIDHAVIRLYNTENWQEIKPVLTVHSLTVASLCFSEDDAQLLSVGRDRKWAVFQRVEGKPLEYSLRSSNPKAHTRMIHDCDWAPKECGCIFVTAGREKAVKIWGAEGDNFNMKTSIPTTEGVSAVSFMQRIIRQTLHLAVGFESGELDIYALSVPQNFEKVAQYRVGAKYSFSRTITSLCWRPCERQVLMSDGEEQKAQEQHESGELAVASEDTSLRLFKISELPLSC